MKFRKKPVVIDAVQWDGANLHEVNDMAGLDAVSNYQIIDGALIIHTLEGDMRAGIGDWIIKGVNKELYPCKPDIFAATYEAVDTKAPG